MHISTLGWRILLGQGCVKTECMAIWADREFTIFPPSCLPPPRNPKADTSTLTAMGYSEFFQRRAEPKPRAEKVLVMKLDIFIMVRCKCFERSFLTLCRHTAAHATSSTTLTEPHSQMLTLQGSKTIWISLAMISACFCQYSQQATWSARFLTH
jgi:hypothetical protein